MELSVIIVSYNVSSFLRNCLHSLIQATAAIKSEIIVIDNNSSDESCFVVSNEFPSVTLIRNKINRGFASANNQGIRISAGRYVLLLNPDTIVPDDTISKCLTFMDQHPDAGALGIKMTDGDGDYLPESKRSFPAVVPAFFKSFGFAALFPRSEVLNRYYLTSVGIDETAYTEVIAGAFMLIRRDVLEKTGLLDEDYFMYGEDIEMSYRITKAGFRNYYFPEAKITHFKGKSASLDRYDDILEFYRAMRIYVRKRYSEGSFKYSRNFLYTGIFFREAIALVVRFFRINSRV